VPMAAVVVVGDELSRPTTPTEHRALAPCRLRWQQVHTRTTPQCPPRERFILPIDNKI
jgi:hypothetical protein